MVCESSWERWCEMRDRGSRGRAVLADAVCVCDGLGVLSWRVRGV